MRLAQLCGPPHHDWPTSSSCEPPGQVSTRKARCRARGSGRSLYNRMLPYLPRTRRPAWSRAFRLPERGSSRHLEDRVIAQPRIGERLQVSIDHAVGVLPDLRQDRDRLPNRRSSRRTSDAAWRASWRRGLQDRRVWHRTFTRKHPDLPPTAHCSGEPLQPAEPTISRTRSMTTSRTTSSGSGRSRVNRMVPLDSSNPESWPLTSSTTRELNGKTLR